MILRPGLAAAVAILLLVAGAGRAQYVEDSIQVQGPWVGSLAYNSREDVIYGTCEYRGVFAIACENNRVISTIPLYGAESVCYDSLDNKAFCVFQDWDWHDSLLVVDGGAHSRVKAIPISGASMAIWSPALNRVYVSCQNSAQVAVVDCVTDSLLAYIPVGRCPIKLYTNEPGRRLYVLNFDDHSVSIVNMETNLVLKTIAIGGPEVNAGYYSRCMDKFYCAGDQEVVAIDGRADSVVARIPVAKHGAVFAVSGSDKHEVIVASVYVGAMQWYAYTIDAVSDTVAAVIEAAGTAYAIHLSQTSDRFYYTSGHSHEVMVLSGDGRRHLMSLPVASGPYVIAESPVQRRLYIGHLGNSKVYVIRDATTAWPEGQWREPDADTASALRLDPSPFRSRLSIAGGTSVPAGEVRVFAEDGRLVRSLNPARSAGEVLRLTWDGRDSRGRFVPPGVYVVMASGGAHAKAVKLW